MLSSQMILACLKKPKNDSSDCKNNQILDDVVNCDCK